MPDAADILTEELQGPSELKTDDAWWPYGSKMVSGLVNYPSHS